MIVNFWSIILIASASQCLFLMLLLLTRTNHNPKALRLLIALLLVLFAINTNNLWYAGRIYYTYPWVTGMGRGLSLLVGPLFYLYARAISESNFRFHWRQWLHIVPYLAVWGLLALQNTPADLVGSIAMVDSFMGSGLRATPLSLTRFAMYIVQLVVYIWLARKVMKDAAITQDYLIPLKRRKRWISSLNYMLTGIAAVFVFFTAKALITGYYGFYSNFWLTIVYSGFIYFIAFRAVANTREVLPDFNRKYGNINLKEEQKNELLSALIRLFEEEKVFLNTDLKLADLASQLNSAPHVITTLINQELGKTFSELLNQYRIQEFIVKSKDPQFAHLSILGIAQEVGYKSKSSFNTAFKKQTGQTPSKYLKSTG